MAAIDNLIKQVAEYQNNKVELTGKPMQKDDEKFWSKFLHTWTNIEWEEIFQFFQEVHTVNDQILNPSQLRQLDNARMAFIKSKSSHLRCMDTKPNKKFAWSVAMIMREFYNSITSTPKTIPQITRKTVTTEYRTTTTTTYHDLFDEE